jgi:hypothetical protein
MLDLPDDHLSNRLQLQLHLTQGEPTISAVVTQIGLHSTFAGLLIVKVVHAWLKPLHYEVLTPAESRYWRQMNSGKPRALNQNQYTCPKHPSEHHELTRSGRGVKYCPRDGGTQVASFDKPLVQTVLS